MKKMKKLLSVVLAVIMALTCMSVMASAAKTSYQTVADLNNLKAYSPYGQVTRLSTEERASIVLDFLDSVLPGLNINMGTVLDVLGLTITINFTSVDNMLASIDTFKSTFSNFLFSIAKGIVNLGILEELSFDPWAAGMSRDGTAQDTIFFEILQLLSGNEAVIGTVLNNGLDLGIVGGMIGNLDLSGINEKITDLPGMVKGLIYPLFRRWDDTTAEITKLENCITGKDTTAVSAVLSEKVGNYFKKPMSMTTVKANSAGTIISEHELPGGNTHRRKYVQSGTTITVYEYYTQSDVDKDELDDIKAVGYMSLGTYQAQEEYPGVEGTDYVFVQVTDSKGEAVEFGQTLKYYEIDSYWLPSFVAANGTINITTESAAALLYKMIPYVFETMAPTVVNGSLKKLLAQLFGMQWLDYGLITDDEALAEIQALPGYNASLEIFGEQGDYIWEWSAFDKITVDGVDHYYYRFEDQLFVGDASNCNDYFEIINWDFTLTGDFLNEFIPTGSTGTETSAAGYTRILHGVNDFVCKLADLVLADGATDIAGTKTFTLNLTEGGNENLISNVKVLAQALLGFHPEHIFGAYEDAEGNVSYGDFYNMIMSNDNDTILVGVAGLVIDALAPQVIIEPEAIYNASTGTAKVTVGALLAAMLRELATQLLPSVNYDALIYANYNTGEFVSGKDNNYWLDVLLTMGTDIGLKYLTALADMNEDLLTDGYFNAGGVIDWNTSRTYTEADLRLDNATANLWESRVDFIIDWALHVDKTGTYSCWSMANFVGKHLSNAGVAYDIAASENPWPKVDAIFDAVLFFDQFTSTTDLEVALRGTILNLVNLEWDSILGSSSKTGLLDIPASSKLRTTNILQAVSLEVRDLINALFMDVGQSNDSGAGTYYFIPQTITSIDQLLNQSNIATIARTLVGNLDDAHTNGLLVTAFPFLNFFLGWKTDPQVMADPVIWTSFYESMPYSYQSSSTIGNATISFQNNSSGMLEKHRDSTVTDHQYDIQITNVTSNATKNAVSFTWTKDSGKAYATVSPYETFDISLGGTFKGDEAFTVTVEYNYIGKDGQPVGGAQYKAIPMFMSNIYPDTNIEGRESGDMGDGTNYSIAGPFVKYNFTEDIYTSVTTFRGSISGTNASLAGTSKYKHTNAPDPVTRDCNGNITDSSSAIKMTGYAAKYFSYYQNRDGGWGESFPKDGSTSGLLYYANTGVTEATEFEIGVYDMGQVGVKYGDDTKVYNLDFIHYDDYDIGTVQSSYAGRSLTIHDIDESDANAVAVYNRYEDALENLTRLATYPKKTTLSGAASSVDYVGAIMPQIEPAIEEMEAAAEALDECIAEAQASGAAADLPAGAQLIDTELANDGGIDYQDYRLYEYFAYADLRTAARNLMATYQAPVVLSGGYIEGSGISYEELTTSVIPAVTNSNVAIGIENSITMYTAEEIAASQTAFDNFQQPYNTYLQLADFASRLAYYRSFLEDVPANKLAADTQFLAKEIAYANANFTDSTIYTAGSWAAFQDALTKANQVMAGTYDGYNVPSTVFAVKFELMKAMKNLLLVSESANENGAVDNLIALKEDADAIFAMNYADIELSDEAIAAGMTKDEALGHLIRAIGYYYTGEDGNEWNLYADSALEYIDNDRPNKSTNLAKIAATETNLTAALAYFAVEEVAPELGAIDGTTGAFGEVTTDETTGITTGYIYGVTAGDAIETNFALVDDTTGYTKNVASTLSGGSENGTGAKVQVYNNSDVLVAEYTLIIFGDVNGDASITAADYSAVKGYTMGVNLEAAEALIAADCVDAISPASSEVTASDYSAVKSSTMGVAITVNPYVA